MQLRRFFQLVVLPVALIAILGNVQSAEGAKFYTKEKMLQLRERVRGMFQHAYDGYLRYASNYDELRPLTCDGVDTWGSYSLTLIDALDTLATMGNFSEFRRVALLLEQKMDFDKDINVSVFETNIRIVGGLLSAHLLSKRASVQLEDGWPCQGPLLRLAENVARRLLPAFDTATGMPYGTVNLRFGVPKGETAVTCTAGVGTFLIEFGTLSRLTGNPIFEEVALNAVYSLWERRSNIGLFGNHIDVQTGRWTAIDSGIGAGVDSFFEYLVKASILLKRPDLLELFHEARKSIDKYLKHDGWYVWAGMVKGQITLPVFQSLEAFWPGILSIIGDTGPAMRTLVKYSHVWHKYGFLPEFYNIILGEALPNRESYPLRPELAESLMYLYRVTKNQFLLEIGEKMIDSIDFGARTRCGYATIRNVITHEKENRMESFFLSETTKYLYLLFDEDNFLHSDADGGKKLETRNGVCVVDAGVYIFNTEAHPIDMSALHCCHDLQENIFEDLDLSVFSEGAIMKADRERYVAEKEKRFQVTCADRVIKERQIVNEEKRKQKDAESNLSVDIEVFDEDNNPAADLLIRNFERVKNLNEFESPDVEIKEVHKNQLTVTDLEHFFSKKRSEFQTPESVLLFVKNFMKNYTMEASFISGLQILDRNITTVLGSTAQKQYEQHARTIWELYELERQYIANVELLTRLDVNGVSEDNMELLDNVLHALSLNERSNTNISHDALASVLEHIDKQQLQFQLSHVNTTSMQNFLLKIFISGTTNKRQSFSPLLNDTEISQLISSAEHRMFENAQLFAHARRVVEFKRRVVETFKRLQVLMQENGKETKTTDGAVNKGEAMVGRIEDEGGVDSLGLTTDISAPTFLDETGKEMRKNDQNIAKNSLSAIKSEDADNAVDSVWTQLVQSILRKTTLQRNLFDAEVLMQKTREALQKYTDKQMKYELYTCPQPTFSEKFAYRDYYP